LALAQACRPTLILLGRSPLRPEPAELANVTDEAALKRELLRLQPGAAPRDLGQRYKELIAARDIRRSLDLAGGPAARAAYYSVDVRLPGGVAEWFEEVRREHGPIRGLIHGAGVLADARIEDKTAEQFDRVWETKVAGLRSLLSALEGDDLRALVLFSSST